MSFYEDIFKEVRDMDEMKAKKLLAEVFTKVMKLDKNDYSKEECLKEIRQIYGAFAMESSARKTKS